MEPLNVNASPELTQKSVPRGPSKETKVAKGALPRMPGHTNMNEMPTPPHATQQEPTKEAQVVQQALSCMPGDASMNETPTPSRVTEKPKTKIKDDPRESYRKPNRLFQFDQEYFEPRCLLDQSPSSSNDGSWFSPLRYDDDDD